MKRTRTRNSIVAALILLVVFFGTWVYLIYRNARVSVPQDTKPFATTSAHSNSEKPITGKCGLQVITPQPNAHVTFPLRLTGTIDNTDAQTRGCAWQMFEGQAGSIHTTYLDAHGDWQPLDARPLPVAEWMSTHTSFDTVLDVPTEITNALPSGTRIKILFTEENPSGMPPVDTFELPLTL